MHRASNFAPVVFTNAAVPFVSSQLHLFRPFHLHRHRHRQFHLSHRRNVAVGLTGRFLLKKRSTFVSHRNLQLAPHNEYLTTDISSSDRNRKRSATSPIQMSQPSSSDMDSLNEDETAMRHKSTMILNKLNELYPNPPRSFLHHSNPFTLLIAVLLSAQTTDEKVNKVTPELFRRASTPKDMINLGENDIKSIIKSVGLSNTKAKNIFKLSNIVDSKFAGEIPSDITLLESLPGVGHKTASVVVMQAFNIPAFPVDTHIHRLACRWGCGDGKSVVKTEALLKTWFPNPHHWFDLHIKIILFGRQYCKATRHDMDTCPICKFAATEEARKFNLQFPTKFVAPPTHKNPYSVRNTNGINEDAYHVTVNDEEPVSGQGPIKYSKVKGKGNKRKTVASSVIDGEYMGNQIIFDGDDHYNAEFGDDDDDDDDFEIQPDNRLQRGVKRKADVVKKRKSRKDKEDNPEESTLHVAQSRRRKKTPETQGNLDVHDDDEAEDFEIRTVRMDGMYMNNDIENGRSTDNRVSNVTSIDDALATGLDIPTGNDGNQLLNEQVVNEIMNNNDNGDCSEADLDHANEINEDIIMDMGQAPEKRKRGRPRKLNKVVIEPKEKRPRGRPKKIIDPEAVESPKEKKPRGRPRKTAAPPEAEQVKQKKPRGRPRKNPPSDIETPPPKEKKPKGRPRKIVVPGTEPEATTPKRRRGRPRKNVEPGMESVVMPSPNAYLNGEVVEHLEPPPKRPRGRPRKNVVPGPGPVGMSTPDALLNGELVQDLESPDSERRSPRMTGPIL